MFGQHNTGLHDVQVVEHFWIGVGQASRQEVCLLLVITFEADTIAGPCYRLEQRRRGAGRHHLSICELTARPEPFLADLRSLCQSVISSLH